MKSSVFEFVDYRKYLTSFISSQPNSGRGWGARIAQHIGCHTSLVSQVFSGRVDFSLEQALKLSELLGLGPDESEYLLHLVSKSRAGTRELKKHFEEKISTMLDLRKQVVNRIGKTAQLSLEDQVRYYSLWHYAVIHVLVAIPQYRTTESILSVLDISRSRLGELLEDLNKMGLIVREGAQWVRTEKQLHLPSKSPMIKKHHQNWRLKALESIDEPKPQDMHYSSLIGIARKDADKIREALLAAVKSAREIVKDSEEEGIYCYNIDFFEVV